MHKQYKKGIQAILKMIAIEGIKDTECNMDRRDGCREFQK